MPKGIELLKLDANIIHCCRALSLVLWKYNDYFKRKVDPYYDKNKRRKINKKHYPFIPSNLSSGLTMLLIALLNKFKIESLGKSKFLDCGCGIGNIVMLAHSIGYAADGIEYDGKTHRIAKKLTRAEYHPNMRIIRGDITTFRNYSKYDVIFYYVPISNVEKMQLFVDRLKEKAKVGAYIIPYNSCIQTSNRNRIQKVKIEWPKEIYESTILNLHSMNLYKKVTD